VLDVIRAITGGGYPVRKRAALVLIVVSATSRFAGAQPTLDLPATNSVQSYSQVSNTVAQQKLDANRVRCIWRGTIPDLNKAVVVVWFTPTKDSLTDPAIKDDLLRLSKHFAPALRKNPTIEVVIFEAWLPALGGVMSISAGFSIRRDPKSEWRRFGDSADDKHLFEAVQRALGSYKLN
jgi:hypothetical protein